MMTLLKLAESEKIVIDSFDFNGCYYGLYIKYEQKKPIILLDKMLSEYSPFTRCILAEELGHHFTTIGNTIYLHKNYCNKLKVGKIEKAALKWASKTLIPTEELINFAQNNKHSMSILAERFNVTMEFMELRMKIFAEEETHHSTLFQRMHIKETTSQLIGSFSSL